MFDADGEDASGNEEIVGRLSVGVVGNDGEASSNDGGVIILSLASLVVSSISSCSSCSRPVALRHLTA